MWLWTIMLVPVLLPAIIGVVLALILTRPRTDLLALLASSLVLLGYQLLCLKFNHSFSTQSALLSMNGTRTTLVAVTSASVSMGLFIPYILARWGAEAVDHIRRKRHSLLRRESKGNLVLSILFGIIFVSMLAQSLPMLIEVSVPAFYEARQEALQSQQLESKTNDITTH
jgi:hypothetical protein